jgi:hypothetical protein
MPRHFSFEDKRVGRGENSFFKVHGTKERPQRIAYIPAAVTEEQLNPTIDLKRRAAARDPVAIEALEDARALREQLTASLRKSPPSAQVWADQAGKKAILYAKTEAARTIWIDGVGYVYAKDGVPPELLTKDVQVLYGFVVLEYELDAENEPILLTPDRQIELGGGHKLNFRYELKTWSLSDAKIRTWKEHSRTNPVIATDYLVWTQHEGKYDRTKFSPAGPAIWRNDPVVMDRVIGEAAGLYANLPRTLAKDFSVEELTEMLSGGQPGSRGQLTATATTTMPEETDFAALLGGGSAIPEEAPAAIPTVTTVPLFTALEEGLQEAEDNKAIEAHRKVIEDRSL